MTFSDDEEVLGVGVTREGWLEVVLGGKRLVARTTNSLLGGPTHVYLALARGNTAVKVIWPLPWHWVPIPDCRWC